MKKLITILMIVSLLLCAMPAMGKTGEADVSMNGKTYHLTLESIDVVDGRLRLVINGLAESLGFGPGGFQLAATPMLYYGEETIMPTDRDTMVGNNVTCYVDHDTLPDRIMLVPAEADQEPILFWENTAAEDAAIPAESVATAAAGAENKFCPYCGEAYPAEEGFAFCPNCGRELPKTSTSREEEQETIGNVSVGEIVRFGSYEQDNDTANGKEEIEWIVLDVQDGKALLISRYALDCQRYNTSRTDITWEECTLRTWLNDEFLNAAFSDREQERILTAKVTADENPRYSTDPGNDTMDQIFLFSIREANEYFSSDSDRQCKPTAYADAKGCYVDGSDGTTWWWLRTPGRDANVAAFVYANGAIYRLGDYVADGFPAVRPAFWISLDP